NAGTDDDPAGVQRFERGRHQRTDRREDQGGIEGLRRRDERVAGPFGPQASRKRLLLRVTRRGKGKHASTLVAGDLRDDVGRVAEAIETDALRIAREPERPIADQAGTEQRCGMHIRITLRQPKTKTLVGDAKLGVAAVDVITGEASVHAQVLKAAAAKAAGL